MLTNGKFTGKMDPSNVLEMRRFNYLVWAAGRDLSIQRFPDPNDEEGEEPSDDEIAEYADEIYIALTGKTIYQAVDPPPTKSKKKENLLWVIESMGKDAKHAGTYYFCGVLRAGKKRTPVWDKNITNAAKYPSRDEAEDDAVELDPPKGGTCPEVVTTPTTSESDDEEG